MPLPVSGTTALASPETVTFPLNAPRAAGMSDWYIARQLQNFKSGARGSHPQDYYGMQMGFMGRILQDDQAINDLVAYINTLPAESTQVAALTDED